MYLEFILQQNSHCHCKHLVLPGPNGFFGVEEVQTRGTKEKSTPWKFVSDLIDPTDWFYVLRVLQTPQQMNAKQKSPVEFRRTSDPRCEFVRKTLNIIVPIKLFQVCKFWAKWNS